MNDPDIFRATPRQIKAATIDIMSVGLVPFIQSSPGMGKSTIVRGIAQEFNLELKDHRLSTSAPEDLSGLPRFDENGFARFAPFADLFPIESTPLPEGKDGWLLFLDEFNSARKEVQAAAYKLILDYEVGQFKLHPRVKIVCAGNLMSDRAFVNALSTAMQSRVVNLEMKISHSEWMEDVALKNKYDMRIITYLSQYPGKLMDFKPDHTEKTFCCPRTWEFANKIISTEPSKKMIKPERNFVYGGTITSGVATDFIQFTNVFESLVNIAEVLASPTDCRMPDDRNAKWATIGHLMEHTDTDNFSMVVEYVNRFEMTFRVLYFRGLLIQQPVLHGHAAFRAGMLALNQYLNGPT